MRISGKVAIVFAIFLNAYIYEIFFVNRLIIEFGNNALYIPIVYFLISIPIFFLFGSNKQINYFKRNIILRYILAIVVILNAVFIIVYMQTIIGEQLFEFIDGIILLTLVISSIATLSKYGFETIFHTFMLYTPFILFATIIYTISSGDIRDYGNILPIQFEIKNIYMGFYLLLIPFDLLIINFYKPFYKSNFNSKSLVIISFFIFLYLSLSIFETISIYPPEIIDETSSSLVLRYLSYKGKVLIRNQGIFFFILLLVVSIYKTSLYLYTTRLLLGLKRKYNNVLLIPIAILIYQRVFVFMNVNKYFIQMTIISVVVIAIYALISKIRGIYET